MKIEVYRCENCGKETKDYYKEKGWIHIDTCGLVITNGRTKEGHAITNRFTNLIFSSEYTSGFDFCSLRCFIRWLYLSKDTDNRKDYDKNSFLKEAIKSIVEDEFLKRLVMDCLDLESKGGE